MLIVLDCPGCGKRYEIDAALAGKKSRCKQCGEVFKIPVPTAVSAPPPTSKPPRPPQTASGAGEWQTVLVEPTAARRSPAAGAGPARPSSSSAASGPRTIVLNCPNCQKRYELDEALAGKKSRCKDCGEVFSIPVPRGRASEASRAPGRSAAPASPPIWESVLEDEPASFKASRGPVAPADDEFDLPPPPRAAYPQPIRKTSGSYRHRGSSPDAGFTIAGCYLALALLVVMGFFVWLGAAQPESKRVGQIFVITEFFLRGLGAAPELIRLHLDSRHRVQRGPGARSSLSFGSMLHPVLHILALGRHERGVRSGGAPVRELARVLRHGLRDWLSRVRADALESCGWWRCATRGSAGPGRAAGGTRASAGIRATARIRAATGVRRAAGRSAAGIRAASTAWRALARQSPVPAPG